MFAIVVIVSILVSGCLEKGRPSVKGRTRPFLSILSGSFVHLRRCPAWPHVLEVLQYASGRRQTGALHLERNSALKSENIYFFMEFGNGFLIDFCSATPTSRDFALLSSGTKGRIENKGKDGYY